MAGRFGLVGDASDGYPGIPRIGPVSAARLLNKHGIIEDLPPTVLGDSGELALLFISDGIGRDHADSR